MGVTVESAVITHLRSVTNVTQYVSTFSGAPAIFSDEAPQQASGIYVVLNVNRISTDNLGVDSFLIDIDIYGGRNESVSIRALTLAIEFALDRDILDCDNYKTIRFYAETEGFIDNRDIQIKHYNMQFSARGSRYAWMQQL